MTLITDNMAGYFMHAGKIDLVIVGADRIAANGDAANKIGTYSLAVLAKEHHIPFTWPRRSLPLTALLQQVRIFPSSSAMGMKFSAHCVARC